MAKKPWHQKRISHKVSFSILVLAIILAAIPLTVLMSQRQQSTEQHASTAKTPCPDRYGNAYGNCANVNLVNCSTAYVQNQCPGASYIQCCPGTLTFKPITTTTTRPTCAGMRGSCQIEYGKGAYHCYGAWISGYCPGSLVCCVPEGNLLKR